MPLLDSCTDEAIQQNIQTLIDEGKDPDQAAAIAYDMCKEKRMQDAKQYMFGGSIKMVKRGVFEGYLVAYRDYDTRDFHGEYFCKKTDLMLKHHKIDGKPILYQHGYDDHFQMDSLGVFAKAKLDDVGLWVQGQLDLRDEWLEAVEGLIEDRALDLSSGAFPQGVLVDSKTGMITRWPIVEGSLTPTPAEPFGGTRVHTAKSFLALPRVYDAKSFLAACQDRGHEVKGTGDGATNDTRDKSRNKPITIQHPMEDNIMGKKMNEEQANALMQAIQQTVMEVLASFMDEAQMQVTDDELEELQDEMVDIVEELIEEEEEVAKQEGEEEEEDEMRKSFDIERLILANLDKVMPAKIKQHIQKQAQKEQKRKQAVSQAIGNVQAGTLGSSAKRKRGAYGTGYNPGKAPAHIGRAERPGLAKFIKSAATHNFSDFNGKAQNPYIGDHGGYLLGQELREEILEPLRANVVAFDAGVRQTNVEQGVGVITLPKMTTAPTAYRPGINTAVSDSDASFDTVTAFLRPIAAKTTIPFQLLDQSPMAVEDRIRDEMIRSIALQIDLEILNGTGTVTGSQTGAEIRGIKTVLEADASLSSDNIVTLATNGRKPTFNDASAAETRIAISNVPDTEPKAFIMHARSRGRFRDLAATTGEPLFRENYGDEAFTRLLGYPVHVGNQIPVNITTGTSTDTSEIYFGAWRFIEYVMQNSLEIIVDRVTVADQLQARIIAYTYSDILIHYPEAFYVIKGVR